MFLLKVVPGHGVRELVADLLQCYLYAFGVTFALAEPILSVFVTAFLRFFKHHLLCIKILVLLSLEKIKKLWSYYKVSHQ